MLNTTKEYASATTIHGLAYVSDDNHTRLDRTVWLIVVIMSFSFTTYQVVTLYKEWQDNPVITMLDTVAEPIDNIEFPAVTICPQGSRKEIMDAVLFKQLKEYIKNQAGNGSNLTPEEMMIETNKFLTTFYPGANGKPTKLMKLMTSSNPSLIIKNDAIIQPKEECDPASNFEIFESLNKELNNDLCPKGFNKLGNMSCIHSSKTKMSYDEASQYCDDQHGSKLLYLSSHEDIELINHYIMAGKVFFVYDIL